MQNGGFDEKCLVSAQGGNFKDSVSQLKLMDLEINYPLNWFHEIFFQKSFRFLFFQSVHRYSNRYIYIDTFSNLFHKKLSKPKMFWRNVGHQTKEKTRIYIQVVHLTIIFLVNQCVQMISRNFCQCPHWVWVRPREAIRKSPKAIGNSKSGFCYKT